MQKPFFAMTAICMALLSCTKDKTDYKAIIHDLTPEIEDFQEAATIQISTYRVMLEVPAGKFQTGHNTLRLKIIDQRTNQAVPAHELGEITLLPVSTDKEEERRSGPHQHELSLDAQSQYHTGFAVFPEHSKPDKHWDVYMTFGIAGSTYKIQERIQVYERSNTNLSMAEFIGNDGEQYFITLLAPHQPKVGKNDLIASIYRYNRPFSYPIVNGYTLLLDPRMPEASMGNHSSPNNQDLSQQIDGYYHGVVNYTMTGNWTLNFILLDTQGDVIKGTEVPPDFTPGIPGVKSELHINILF